MGKNSRTNSTIIGFHLSPSPQGFKAAELLLDSLPFSSPRKKQNHQKMPAMASLPPTLNHHPLPKSLTLRRRLHSHSAAFSKPFSPPPPSSLSLNPSVLFSPPKPSLSLRASHAPVPPSDPKPIPHNPLSIAAAVATAAAALFFARLHSPAPALAAFANPPPTVSPSIEPDTFPISEKDAETLTDAEKERFLEEHLDAHPDDISTLRALMEHKIENRNLPEAIAIVDRLIALEPDEKELPLLKCHLQSYSGDAEAAKQGFKDLLEKNPFQVEAYHGLVLNASNSEDDSGELDRILEQVESAMELCKKANRKEDLRDFKLLLAQIRVIEGKYEDSLKIYQQLVKEEPRDFRPYLCQGIIYTLLKKKDEAEQQFQKYRRLVPKGHPYAQYFDDNMAAMKMFGQMDENRRQSASKN